MKERNSPGYEGVGNPLPLVVTPSLLCLKPHCDCIDPLPPCAPGAALMWDSCASFSSCFPRGAWREQGIRTSCRNNISMGAQVKETPKMAFLIYVGNPAPKPTAKQEDVCVSSIHQRF